MPVETLERQDHLLHIQRIREVPQLDLTSPLWKLGDGQASELVGVDVTEPNHFRLDRGRKPIGVSIPASDRPIYMVEPSGAEALVSIRRTGVVHKESGSFLKSLTSGTYQMSLGSEGQVLVSTPGFAGYSFRQGDKLLIHNPLELRGAHDILKRNSDINIQITPGLVNSDTTITEMTLVQGLQMFSRTFDSTSKCLVLSPELYDRDGPWPSEMVNQKIALNIDARLASPSFVTVKSVGTYARENDCLVFDDSFSIPTTESKVSVVSARSEDRQGIWVSNGRKFWLLQDGSYKLMMDLNDDTFLGTRWRMARIAADRFLLVSSKFAPRILRLSLNPEADADAVVGDETLAGVVPPRKPLSEEDVREDGDPEFIVQNPSWLSAVKTGKGSLTAGSKLKIKVRGVDLVDGVSSDFVQVALTTTLGIYPSSPSSSTSVQHTVAEGDGVSVSEQRGNDNRDENLKSWSPVFHSRMTHIEIWRTRANEGSSYFRESRIEIADKDLLEPAGGSLRALAYDNINGQFPVRLSDEDILGLPILTQVEEESGGLPPICRDSVNLLGVTLCFGKADSSKVNPILYARNLMDSRGSYEPSTGVITLSETSSYLEILSGDEVVVVDGGKPSTPNDTGNSIPRGNYEITSVTNNSVTISKNLTTAVVDDVGFYVRRPFTIEWPFIISDEDVWYSRTDLFAPENFPPRILSLSRNGDTFRRAVKIADYALVVMDQGVHLLFLDGTELRKNTVADFGAGTPWPDSVVVLEDNVYWATQDGVRALSTSPEVDNLGRRANLGFLDRSRFASWFREALDNGEDIDGGFDPRFFCLRFRRKKADHVFQVLQYSFQTKNWTLLEGDNGIRYVQSIRAETQPRITPALYSVDGVTGAVFLVNHRGTTHPYDGFTVQDTLDGNYSVKSTSIRHKNKVAFTSLMVGEIITLKTSSGTVLRTILTATGRKITFDSVSSLKSGDEFLIGANPFRLRSAPFQGLDVNRVKTLRGVTLRARPGERNGTLPRPIEVSARENFQETVVSSDSVTLFNDGDAGKTSRDRLSSVEAQGNAIEVSLESEDTRNDFQLESLELQIEEERGELVDEVST